MKKNQQGSSLLVVLVLLTVLLLGVVSLARQGDATSVMAANSAAKGAALAASDVGIADADEALAALAAPDGDVSSWYSAIKLVDDANGLPSGVAWSSLPGKQVGSYTVRYFVERLCSVSPVTDVNRECSVQTAQAEGSSKVGVEALMADARVEYRTTVLVSGGKGLETYVQGLAAY